MADKIHLEIVTPEHKVVSADVDRVDVPGLDGELGILPGHTELISQLKPAGILAYFSADQKTEIAISAGFVEVTPDRVTVLADDAERPEDIDVAKALRLKEQAERNLQLAASDDRIDLAANAVDLERATIRLQLADRAAKR